MINNKLLPDWTHNSILEGYRGSHAHGTYMPSSDPNSTDDIDIFRIVVQPEEYYVGLSSYYREHEHYETFIGHYDILIFDIRKYFHLLTKGNPNVHIFLWLRPEDYFSVAEAGQYLISNRTEFLSQKVIHSFGGYAADQLRRMSRYRFEGYMGAKRKRLAEQYGYDCRNASHCIRLLLTAIDLLKTGQIIAYREKDKNLLLEIKTGKWSLEELKQYADELRSEFENLLVDAALSPDVDAKKLDSILLNTMRLAWDEQKSSHKNLL